MSTTEEVSKTEVVSEAEEMSKTEVVSKAEEEEEEEEAKTEDGLSKTSVGTGKTVQKGSFEYNPIKTTHDRLKLNALVLYLTLTTTTNFVMIDYMLNIHTLRHAPANSFWNLQLILFFTPLVGVLFAFWTDCAFEDYRVELAVSTLSVITTILATVMNFFYPFSEQTLYYSYVPFFIQYSTTSNSWSFVLFQLRHMKVDVDQVWFVYLLLHLTFLSIFKACSEIIRSFISAAFLPYFFTFWQSIVAILRLGILILLYKYIKKHSPSFGHFATVALVTFSMIVNLFKGRRKTQTKFQDVDIFYTKRFWVVVSIMCFFVFSGLNCMGHLIVLYEMQPRMIKSDSLLENFQGFYFFSGVVGVLLYFFVLIPLLKRKGIILKELKHFGISLGLLTVSLIYLAILQSIVFAGVGTVPKKGNVQMKLYNLANSSAVISSELINTTLSSYSMITFSIHFEEMAIRVHIPEFGIHESTSIRGVEAKSIVYAITSRGIRKLKFEQDLTEDSRGKPPLIYLLPSSANVTLNFKKGTRSEKKIETNNEEMKAENLEEGLYEIQAMTNNTVVLLNFNFEMDSIYAVLLFQPITPGGMRIFTIRNPRTVDFKWTIPFIFLMGLADMIQLYTLMKLAMYQGPPHLRTFVIAIGDMLVRSTDCIHFFPWIYEDKDDYGSLIFVVLTIHVVSISVYTYRAIKYTPYVFKTHGKY